MSERNDPPYPTGAWIFVSHSHKDLAKVRLIRDALERLGHKPLLFYLKCLEDDSAELPDLLRREIGSRTWFILCDSSHSRESAWVQKEVEIIRSLEGKVYEVVDLDEGVDEYLEKVTRLSRRATVFLSCSARDFEIAGRIADRLRQEEYQVLDIRSVQGGRDLASAVGSAIDEAARRGFVLVLLSRNSLGSPHVREEVRYAMNAGSAIVPVIIGDTREVFASSLGHVLAVLQHFDLTGRPFEEALTDLVTMLKTREVQ